MGTWEMSSTHTQRRKTTRTSKSSLATRLPNDWIVGTRIGVIAYALSQRTGFVADSNQRQARRALINHLYANLSAFIELGLHPTRLPVSTLHMLSRREFIAGINKLDRQLIAPWTTLYSTLTVGPWG